MYAVTRYSSPDTRIRGVPPIIRLSHPLAFAAYLKHLGAPAQKHLRRTKLPANCENPDVFVPLLDAWSVFDSAAQAEDEALGWHVGRYVGERCLHLDLLNRIEHAPTLYLALHEFARLVSTEASQLQLAIVEREDDILFCTQYENLKECRGYHSSQSYQLAVYLVILRHYLGSDWVPEEIGIEQKQVPTVAKISFPGSRILKGQRMGYIAVPRSCLHTGPPKAQPTDNDTLTLSPASCSNYSDTLECLIRPHLASGYPTASSAARLMDTSVRTLARRLIESDTSYREVVDKVRFDTAKELMQDQKITIREIAGEVGFDDPAHFSRMFCRIAGTSPARFRKSLNHSA